MVEPEANAHTRPPTSRPPPSPSFTSEHPLHRPGHAGQLDAALDGGDHPRRAQPAGEAGEGSEEGLDDAFERRPGQHQPPQVVARRQPGGEVAAHPPPRHPVDGQGVPEDRDGQGDRQGGDHDVERAGSLTSEDGLDDLAQPQAADDQEGRAHGEELVAGAGAEQGAEVVRVGHASSCPSGRTAGSSAPRPTCGPRR